MPDIYDPRGRLIERRDDAAQTVTVYDPASGAVVSSRAYTADEAAALTAAATAVTEATNAAMLLAKITAQVDELQALIGSAGDPAGTTTLRAIKGQTAATINAGPAPYVKALADALITTDRALIRLSRIVARQLASTSDGG